MTLGDPSLSALSVILTEDLKLAMSCIYQAKITTKRREDPEVRKVRFGRGTQETETLHTKSAFPA